MELEYRKCGDYYYESNKVLGYPQAISDCVSGSGSYIPNIVAPENIKNFRLGKYGRLRLNYLKTNKKAEYMILQMENKLQKHLMDVDITATKRVNAIVKALAKKENITEELKANNQLEWVRKDEQY